MFTLAILIGIYSYGIFCLGLLKILTSENIIGFTVSWLAITVLYFRDKIKISLGKPDRFSWIILTLIVIQALVNLVGALGPELGFDALWYHLSLPKIWLQRHEINFLPGPVFRYSVMPKLTETLYAAGLVFSDVTGPKLIHYVFGLLSLLVTYRIARKFISRNYSLLSVLILSQNLVFGWQSTSAYVDLSRTFFEALALYLFIGKKYTRSAITLGLAITVKLVAVFSLPIFLIMLTIARPPHLLKHLLTFTVTCLFIPLPWLLFAYIHTGNPLYPVFSPVLESFPISLNPLDIWNLFTSGSDPISPLYIISAPLIFFKFTKQSRGLREIFIYAGIAVSVWYLTPRSGGGRFLLPYLPALSVAVAGLISKVHDKFIKNTLLFLSVFISVVSISYRTIANWKFIPVLSGHRSEIDFLSSRLNFSFGDYADTDSYLTRNIPAGESVLVAGVNNLFYFPNHLKLIHISEIKPSGNWPDQISYLLLRQPDAGFAPDKNWTLLHHNPVNHTWLYRKN